MLAQDYLALRLVRLKPTQVLPNKTDGLLFVFSKGGTGKFSSGEVSQALAPGDVLVLPGALGGGLATDDNTEFLFWSFTLSLENIFPLLASQEIPLLQNIENSFKGLRLYPAQTALAKECHRLLSEAPPHFNLEHRSQLLRVVAAIVSQELNAVQSQRVGFVRIEEHMIQVFNKLSAQDILDMSVGELATQFGCSRRHLNRLFHQHFGFSVAALKMEMRLLRAASLLREPNIKIINVAEQCGFNHLGLFNTCFRRRFGASPGQWRKSAHRDEPPPPLVDRGNNRCQLRANGLCPWSSRGNGDLPMLPQNYTPQKADAILAAAGKHPTHRTTSPRQPELVIKIRPAAKNRHPDDAPTDSTVFIPPSRHNTCPPRS